jgi:hypothetical protein
MTNEPAQPKKRGCFFYGCLALIVTVLVLAVGSVLLFRYGKGKIEQTVNEYTDPAPAQIEKGDASPAKLNAVQTRIDAFRSGLASGQPQELTLTADELNTLLAGQPDLSDLANKVYVVIDGDQMKANISWPLPDIGPLKLKGRYLNGTATLKASVTGGNVDLHIQDFESKGKPLPAQLLQELRKHDIGDDLMRDQQAASAIRQIDNLEVKDGKVIIRSK